MLVAVDGLGVEAALDSGWQLAGAMGIEGDVLDRLDLRRVAAVAARPRAARPGERLGVGLERHAGEQAALVADLRGGAGDRGGGAARRGGVVAVAVAEAVGVRGHDLDVERGDAELAADELRVLALVAVGG